MHFLLLAAMLAAPFWETKTPETWSDEELHEMLHDSPWAQTTTFREGTPLAVYLATAKPMRIAEAEFERRYTAKIGAAAKPQDLGARHEYEAFLAENQGKVIVVAIRNPNLQALAQAEEMKRLQEESFLKAGKKKMKMTGHFPPAGADPVLRLVFPRPDPSVKQIQLDLYVPGYSGGYRQAYFTLKDLRYQGQVEM